MSRTARIALIGDLHGSWDDFDLRWFDQSGYDLLLFTGDLGSGSRDNGVQIARAVGRLAKPALVMLGNNDAKDAPRIVAELAHQRGLAALGKLAPGHADSALVDASGEVRDCGYSLHSLRLADRTLSLLAARPFAMGGGSLTFPERLRERYGISSLEQSTARLCQLVESAEGDELVVLAHNGPHGLGAEASDIWGCDFRSEAGDWGDPDLSAALAHARAIGKRVLAVIAGHMHLRTKQGQERGWLLERDGVTYVNAARVPRIYPGPAGALHHHLALELDTGGRGVRVREVLVNES